MRSIGIIALAGLTLLIASALPWTRETGGADPANAAYGKALFQAKGCATCHEHHAISGANTYYGGPAGTPPDLTNYRNEPAALRAWLRDPPAIKPTTGMPNLGLSDAEIAALIAFLNDPPGSEK